LIWSSAFTRQSLVHGPNRLKVISNQAHGRYAPDPLSVTLFHSTFCAGWFKQIHGEFQLGPPVRPEKFELPARSLMKTTRFVPLGCLAVFVATISVAAPPPGKGKEGKGSDKAAESKKSEPVAKVGLSISMQEREIIKGHVEKYRKPGKGKKSGELPPGLAKNAARGKRLPPGWEAKLTKGQLMPVEVFKECQPLPKEITVQLPAPPKGVITITVEGKVVRLLEATREILDVFDVWK